MTITIHLPPDTEANLREQATRKGAKLEDYLSELAQHWVATSLSQTNEKTTDQKVAAWLAWVDSHADVTAIADDSRESIYAGRDE